VLKSIDVLVGVAVVLLALSMAVTVITQSITTIVNSRGRHLRRALSDLLQQLDPALSDTLSKAVATRLLTHPFVSGANTPLAADGSGSGLWPRGIALVRRLVGGPRLGNVVHREEFTKLLLHLADDRGSHALEASALAALRMALSSNGIEKPDDALKAIRRAALVLERENPELSHVARQNLAILREAESDFVAKVNNWFDQSMDRTSQRFTASTRAITFAGAFVVAFGVQVDTPLLVNRLAADDALRQAFVQQAIATHKPQTPPGDVTNDDEAKAQEYRAFLAEKGVITLPGAGGWYASLKAANYFGLLITALLLSLGAPFWYSALGNLLQLRSVLAVKDDAQRMARQSMSSSPHPESGDASAVG